MPGPEGDEDLGKQVQRLRPGLPPTENSEETGWFDGAEYDRLTEGLLNARRRLYDSLALDGPAALEITDAIQQMEAVHSELHSAMPPTKRPTTGS